MGRTIFVEIGAHLGATLTEVTEPLWLFDEIHAFEPVKATFDTLVDRMTKLGRADRIVFHNAALSDRTGEAVIYGTSTPVGATLMAGKRNIDPSTFEKINVVRASNFFLDVVKPGDICVVHMNCEGGEKLILLDLLESRALRLIHNIVIDFDIAKVKGGWWAPFALRWRLWRDGYRNYVLIQDAFLGERPHRFSNWLSGIEPLERICAEPERMRRARLRPGLWRFVQRTFRGY